MRQIKITKQITNRESPSLDKYLSEIGKMDLISAEEETYLAEMIRKNDSRALEKLVKSNLRFVVSVAKQYQNQGLTLSDLINEGNLGLMKAAIRFDHTKGFKFISYAVWWIRQSILQALAENSRLVRIPQNKVGLNSRISKAYNQLEQEYEREPSAEEIASLLHISSDEVSDVMHVSEKHLSMDSPLPEADDCTFLDVFANPEAEKTDYQVDHKESLKRDIERTLHILSQRQKEIVCYFFGIGFDRPMSLEDIGSKFNLTRERVRQIKDKAISKLQQARSSGALRIYLG